MPTVKTALHSTIELLSDKEARQVMRLVALLKEKKRDSLTLCQLAIDMAFQVPSEKIRPFRTVQPVRGKGIPASRLLIGDRR